MKNMTLTNIAKACGGTLFGIKSPEAQAAQIAGEQEVVSIVLDSRKVEAGSVFIATKGETVDGHSFISQVADKGALGVVCQEKPEKENIPYILVEDSFIALKKIAEFYREQLQIRVVGITGSVGKTSTKEFVAGVLETKYKVLKTAGNFNNEVGLPLTVLQIRPEHEVAVLEMGISNFGEMHRLSKIAKPDICVMTNIGQCHLEFLGTREGILQAKSEIFDFMEELAPACLNGDDDMLQRVGTQKACTPVYYGLSTEHDVYGTDIMNHGLFGSTVTIHTKEESFTADVPLPGIHMVYNALAATAVGIQMGLSTAQIKEGIEKVQAVGGRSNIMKLQECTLIDDCYNANPVSMKAAIDLLNMALGRKVAILGDMFELGEQEKKMHAEVGSYAAAKGLDVLCCVGKLSKNMEEAAREAENKTKIYYFENREALLADIEQIFQPQDTILIKASRGMGFDEVVKKLENFFK